MEHVLEVRDGCAERERERDKEEWVPSNEKGG